MNFELDNYVRNFTVIVYSLCLNCFIKKNTISFVIFKKANLRPVYLKNYERKTLIK